MSLYIYQSNEALSTAFEKTKTILRGHVVYSTEYLADNFDVIGLITCFSQVFSNIPLVNAIKQSIYDFRFYPQLEMFGV